MAISIMKRYRGLIDRISRQFMNNARFEIYIPSNLTHIYVNLGKSFYNAEAEVDYRIDYKALRPVAFEYMGSVWLGIDFKDSIRAKIRNYDFDGIDWALFLTLFRPDNPKTFNRAQLEDDLGSVDDYHDVEELAPSDGIKLFLKHPAYSKIKQNFLKKVQPILSRKYSILLRANYFKMVGQRSIIPYMFFSDERVTYFSTDHPKSDKDWDYGSFEDLMSSYKIFDVAKFPISFITKVV